MEKRSDNFQLSNIKQKLGFNEPLKRKIYENKMKVKVYRCSELMNWHRIYEDLQLFLRSNKTTGFPNKSYHVYSKVKGKLFHWQVTFSNFRYFNLDFGIIQSKNRS